MAAPAVRVLLEVASLADTLPVLTQLGIGGTQLCVRHQGDAHLIMMETKLSALLALDAGSDLVLTGKASTIQHLSRFLKQAHRSDGKRHSKAYWATGKRGLD